MPLYLRQSARTAHYVFFISSLLATPQNLHADTHQVLSVGASSADAGATTQPAAPQISTAFYERLQRLGYSTDLIARWKQSPPSFLKTWEALSDENLKPITLYRGLTLDSPKSFNPKVAGVKFALGTIWTSADVKVAVIYGRGGKKSPNGRYSGFLLEYQVPKAVAQDDKGDFSQVRLLTKDFPDQKEIISHIGFFDDEKLKKRQEAQQKRIFRVDAEDLSWFRLSDVMNPDGSFDWPK